MKVYLKLVEKYQNIYKKQTKKSNLLSWLRTLLFLLILSSVYIFIVSSEIIFLLFTILLTFCFVYLLWLHQKVSCQRTIANTLRQINNNEIAFLEGRDKPFDAGIEYINPAHTYSYDLDIFGNDSLYQYINRTQTYIGGKKLAKRFLEGLSDEEILEKQGAVKELSKKIEWRQKLQQLGIQAKDSKAKYESLLDWTTIENKPLHRVVQVLSFILPSLLLIALFAFIISNNIIFGRIVIIVSIINLLLFLTQYRKLKEQLIAVDNINKTISVYGTIFEHLENEKFTSLEIRRLQTQLQDHKESVSQRVRKLSKLYYSAENIHNVLGAVFFNSLFLFHLHNFRRLDKWKKESSTQLKKWLDLLGEFETLASFANMAYNNPDFCYPEIKKEMGLSFRDLAHPLICRESRVGNDFALSRKGFVILTGSNMSGKSTFLRTIGVNMILARVGSPICAREASLSPLKILVSMRQNDSLASGESYFFAEIKRLKRIMDKLQSEKCLVLLDEILRGTNSEDKREGTEAIVHKLIESETMGIIATHDLKICDIANESPKRVENKCFEVDIIDNDLVFDYQLRQGVCKSRNATFLMKKIGIV